MINPAINPTCGSVLFISRHGAYGSAMQPSERTSNQTSADTVFRSSPVDTHTVLNQPPRSLTTTYSDLTPHSSRQRHFW